MTNAIAAEGIELTYADGTEAVTDVTIHVPSGECFGFVGPNTGQQDDPDQNTCDAVAPDGRLGRSQRLRCRYRRAVSP